MKAIQMCDETVLRVVTRVQSSRNTGDVYDVTYTIRDGDVTCTCPGYKFRGQCKHTRTSEMVCGWREGDEPAQSQREQNQRVCPRCGAQTINRLVGNVRGA